MMPPVCGPRQSAIGAPILPLLFIIIIILSPPPPCGTGGWAEDGRGAGWGAPPRPQLLALETKERKKERKKEQKHLKKIPFVRDYGLEVVLVGLELSHANLYIVNDPLYRLAALVQSPSLKMCPPPVQ